METGLRSKVEAVLKKLTLEEKASLCSGKDFWHLKGIERLNIPSIMVADGPHGLRKEINDAKPAGLNTSVPATCFPTAVGLASTWNLKLIEKVGIALGEECQQEGVSVLLCPGVNIKRSPLCGRNFEYLSEDPFLTGELAASIINGIQSQGVGTSLKHFAANNQEKNRMIIDTIVDERALREIYLVGFEAAIKKSYPWTVMSSYNKVNGEYASENRRLLHDILRKEWGFRGLTVSDWGAVNDRVLGLESGLDLEMPSSGGENDTLIAEAVKDGSLKMDILDTSVRRILELIFKSKINQRRNFTYDQRSHHELARRAASESMVLLKNDNNILPIKKQGKIALIGEFSKKPRYQGSGSSYINPIQLENAYEVGKSLLGDHLYYAQGYDINTDITDEALLKEAIELARESDIVIIMAGLTDDYECEGFDRIHMGMPDSHNKLISAVSQVNSKVVVVLNNGSPVEMPWVNDVSSIIEAYLPGEAGGSALWDILLGEVNPSGRLAESFPIKYDDCPASKYFPMGPRRVEYRESIYVGYRYYDKANMEVLFPFGHGLSYTSFDYSDLKLSRQSLRDDEQLNVYVTVKNTGKRSGMEVVQLYVRDVESSIFRPDKELKGFKKVYLEPGEKKEINFILDKRSFAYYNVELRDWTVETGDFMIMIGASSRDIRCTKRVYIESTGNYDESKNDLRKKLPCYYNISKSLEIEEDQFISLVGENIPEKKIENTGYTRNSTLNDIRKTFIGRILYNQVMKEIKRIAGDNERQLSMLQDIVMEIPLRGLVTISSQGFDFNQIDGLINLLNGNIFKGIKLILNRQQG